ncbi:hypothetical protein SDJN03_04351, partial [Cucurbita argyrosperma subsp. sororia]
MLPNQASFQHQQNQDDVLRHEGKQRYQADKSYISDSKVLRAAESFTCAKEISRLTKNIAEQKPSHSYLTARSRGQPINNCEQKRNVPARDRFQVSQQEVTQAQADKAL